MARKRLELTKMPKSERRTTPRWRKVYNGQRFYYLGTYQEALTQWHRKLAELEAAENAPSVFREVHEKMRKWYELVGQTKDAEDVAGWLKYDNADEVLEINWKAMTDQQREKWLERFRALEPPPTEDPQTINQAAQSYLAKLRVRAETGGVSAGYYDLAQRAVNDFADHVGRRAGAETISSHALESYHTTLLQHTDWSPDYIAGRMRNVKTFVNWCYDMELLKDLPRIMRRGSKVLNVPNNNGNKKKPNFSNEEIKILLDHASERTQLFILLMMNTGYTQVDLAELRPDQVDWEERRITRKRSKTESHEDVPEVSYPLWSRTFALLKKYGKRKGDRVLLNEDGGQLKTEGLRDGRHTKCDNIASAYGRLTRKLTKPKKDKTGKIVRPPLLKKTKSLKVFRKTSPSRLENSQYANCAYWFGGWSPRSVAIRNYIRPPQDLFDKAVRWLAKSYGIEE